jgi:hypothetical protein
MLRLIYPESYACLVVVGDFIFILGNGAVRQCCGAETFFFRSGFDISFMTIFYHRFHIKKWIFHVFMKEYQTNSHAGFYTI